MNIPEKSVMIYIIIKRKPQKRKRNKRNKRKFYALWVWKKMGYVNKMYVYRETY